jgi:hypothetical protein
MNHPRTGKRVVLELQMPKEFERLVPARRMVKESNE